MKMTHPIVEGQISILKVVTPGSYWIKCKNCVGSCRIPESIRQQSYIEDFYPPIGAEVLVHDSDGFFYRGTVCCRGSFPGFASMQARKYTVKLTQTLQLKDIDRCHIYPSFDVGSISCESAHLVSLYGVLPTLPPHDFASPRESRDVNSCQAFIDRVRNWDELNGKVEDLILKPKRFQYEQLAVINGCPYGKLTYFGLTRDKNMKDTLADENISFRASYQFDRVVRSLISRPLHNCSNPSPLYSPGLALIYPVIPKPKPVEYDLSEFRVLEEDVPLHESIWHLNSINIIYTGRIKPVEKNVAVRYVAPNGDIVLGTVLTPHVIYYEMCRSPTPETSFASQMRDYINSQLYPNNPQNFQSCINYRLSSHVEMPPSTDEEDSIHSEDPSLFTYDFDKASSQFTHGGGVLDETYPSLKWESWDSLGGSLNSKTVLELVDGAFNTIGVSSLKDWQLVCLPFMMSKKNILVIGPKSHTKLTTSIISTLSLMAASSMNSKRDNMSPICVLLVNDYSRAAQAAELCKLLSDFKVITSAYSQISDSQKRELLEGCDILISTPGNWLILTKNLYCFDARCLSYIIIDSFEKLHKFYPSEMDIIFRDIYKQEGLQCIFLSNVWGSFLVDFINMFEYTARCAVDLVQACFCYNLVPTVVMAGDDRGELLTSIIQNNQTTLRLLLCHDHFEVTDIKSRTQHLDSVLYVHENEDRQSALDCVNQWKANSATFLVCSDLLFTELDFAHNVNLLVLWMQNSSRSTLNQRFMSIRGHGVRQRRNIPVYIFCSPDNLEELVFIRELLENVKHPVFLSGDLDECIKSAFKAAETLKTSDHCHSLCMFGTCKRTPLCPYRHYFRPQDPVQFVRKNVFLRIMLVKLHSAFHLTARVNDVISNQEASDRVIRSFTSKLSQIEEGLKHAFEIHLSACSNGPEDLKVDDVVGAVISRNVFRRVRILFINHGVNIEYKVSFMDYDESDATFSVNDLFPLPPSLVSYPRDIVDIFTSGSVPVDFNSNWEFETKSLLNNFADLLAENGNCLELLAGAVEAVIMQSIIVNTIHWCRLADPFTYVSDCSMKTVALASKYVEEHSEHLNLLSKLALDCGKQPFISLAEEEFGFRKSFSRGFNCAVVSAFDDPGLFYVQLTSEGKKLQEFEASLTDSLNKSCTRLAVVVEHELCCVQIDGVWNRALILGKDDQRVTDSKDLHSLVTVLCVDYGDTRDMSVHELFRLPNAFFEGIPYFAIECELVGILPSEKHWNDTVIQKFECYIRDPNDRMTEIDVKFYGIANGNQYTKRFRHQVALRRRGDLVTVNHHLVKPGLACWDKATVNLLNTPEQLPPNMNRCRNKPPPSVRVSSS